MSLTPPKSGMPSWQALGGAKSRLTPLTLTDQLGKAWHEVRKRREPELLDLDDSTQLVVNCLVEQRLLKMTHTMTPMKTQLVVCEGNEAVIKICEKVGPRLLDMDSIGSTESVRNICVQSNQ